MKGKPVKITVLRRLALPDLIAAYGNNNDRQQCPVFADGQEFMTDGMHMPAGFCSGAWEAIRRDVNVLSFGGDFPWAGHKGVAIGCCTDGLRPVILKMERVEA